MNLYLGLQTTVIIILSTAASVQDIKSMKIFDWNILAGCLAMAACHFIFNKGSLIWYLCSAIILGTFYLAAKIITHGKLGNADIYFGFFQGLCILPQYIWIILITETLFGAAAFLILKKKTIPFIPVMSAALITGFVVKLITELTC